MDNVDVPVTHLASTSDLFCSLSIPVKTEKTLN